MWYAYGAVVVAIITFVLSLFGGMDGGYDPGPNSDSPAGLGTKVLVSLLAGLCWMAAVLYVQVSIMRVREKRKRLGARSG